MFASANDATVPEKVKPCVPAMLSAEIVRLLTSAVAVAVPARLSAAVSAMARLFASNESEACFGFIIGRRPRDVGLNIITLRLMESKYHANRNNNDYRAKI